MTDRRMLARRFETARPRLLAIATRLLGSTADAEDAVQEAWLRLEAVDADAIENLDAWLTTVVSRGCLDLRRAPQRLGGAHARRGAGRPRSVASAAPPSRALLAGRAVAGRTGRGDGRPGRGTRTRRCRRGRPARGARDPEPGGAARLRAARRVRAAVRPHRGGARPQSRGGATARLARSTPGSRRAAAGASESEPRSPDRGRLARRRRTGRLRSPARAAGRGRGAARRFRRSAAD